MFEIINKRNVNYSSVYYDEIRKQKSEEDLLKDNQKNSVSSSSDSFEDHNSGTYSFQSKIESQENINKEIENNIKTDFYHYVLLGDYLGYLTVCDFYTGEVLFDDRISRVLCYFYRF
jgi:hypothetical protein